MSIAEVSRVIDSTNRTRKLQAQEKASFDYIQAQLIIKGISIVLDGKDTMPTLEEAYPELFAELAKERKAKVEEQKINLSVLRFKQFAQSYNEKFESMEVLKTK